MNHTENDATLDGVERDQSLRSALPATLQKTLLVAGYSTFTPIQLATLPPMLAGRDVRAQAKTGSGKTAAFALAVLQRLDLSRYAIQSMVLCPTRELADQVAAELRRLGAAMANLKILTIYGGVAIGPQQASLTKHAPHILVGTPGRILDHLAKEHLHFAALQSLVLDEADRLLDMGFGEDIATLIAATPAARQTLLFSATFPEAVDRLSAQVQRDALHIATDVTHADATIEQRFFAVPEGAKSSALRQLLLQQQAPSALVFCNTKRDVQELLADLHAAHIPALALHGDLEQRDRSEVLVRFANGSVRVLIATDVAARGLDLKALGLVISYELARDVETHTHRIGRTGRAGETGVALHLVAPQEVERMRLLGGKLDTLPAAALRSLPEPDMHTLVIDAGKTDKLRAGDVLGALTAGAGIVASAIGKIDVTPTRTYVAVARAQVQLALKNLRAQGNTAKIKGRNFRVRLLAT
jgi:ATP-dependent RNA helicase DbpA